MAFEPFKTQVPDSVSDDLKSRLERTRWPEELPGTDWDYGSNFGYVKELVEYWRTKFDWRGQENLINSFSHFKTDVDGLGIHFIHEKGKGPNPMPLVITHGWPSTFFRCTRSSLVPRRGEAGAGARGPGREATRRVPVHHGKRQPLGKQAAHRPGDGGQAPASRRGLGYLDINLRDQYPQWRCDRHRVGKSLRLEKGS